VGLPSIWDGLQGQIYLGSKAFIERIKSNLSPEQSLGEIPRMQHRPLAKPLALLLFSTKIMRRIILPMVV
jgi:putative transposase